MRIIGWETNADESGHFIFMGLPAGEFRLHAKPPWGVEGLIASEPVMVNILIINLGPGEFFDISIGANPRETGMINDVLRIISTDPDLPGYEVQLEAVGIKLFAETDFEMNLPAGWSMISLPVLPYNATASALFQGAIVIYRSNMGAGYARVQINELLQMSVG